MKTNMPKLSEIFDTPEATGFSRVGGNDEIAKDFVINRGWCNQLGNLGVADILIEEITELLTTKDQEKEEEIKKLRYFVAKLYCSAGCDCCRDIPTWNDTSAVLAIMLNIPAYEDGSGFDFYKVRDEALPTEDNN